MASHGERDGIDADMPDDVSTGFFDVTVGAGTQARELAVADAGGVDVPGMLMSAIDGMEDVTSTLTYDGDAGGRPAAHPFVAGDTDPRDADLCESVCDEQAVWHGRIFDVSRLDVRLPNGSAARRDVVRHPGAVAIVALTDDGRICLVRQYRTALGRVTVEIPAGKLEPGEDPLDCAHRELREETGATAGRLAYLTTIATSVGFCDELIHLYMATDLTFDEPSPDADEFINVDVVALGELVDAVLDGRVEDAKTVVGALVCDAVARRLTPEAP